MKNANRAKLPPSKICLVIKLIISICQKIVEMRTLVLLVTLLNLTSLRSIQESLIYLLRVRLFYYIQHLIVIYNSCHCEPNPVLCLNRLVGKVNLRQYLIKSEECRRAVAWSFSPASCSESLCNKQISL